jgi:hypothetical protein
MNFEFLQKYFPFILISILISYFVIKNFNKDPTDDFEKPYDYFKYYVIDTSKDYLKIFLMFPFIFIIIKFIYDKYYNFETLNYDLSIMSSILKEVYLLIIKIAKGFTPLPIK